MKDRYVIYICSECDEQSQFAGFCDSCHSRLGAFSCMPVERICQLRDEYVANSSNLPGWYITQFVDTLLLG